MNTKEMIELYRKEVRRQKLHRLLDAALTAATIIGTIAILATLLILG